MICRTRSGSGPGPSRRSGTGRGRTAGRRVPSALAADAVGEIDGGIPVSPTSARRSAPQPPHRPACSRHTGRPSLCRLRPHRHPLLHRRPRARRRPSRPQRMEQRGKHNQPNSRSRVRPPTAARARRTPPAGRQPATDHRGAAGAGVRPARPHRVGRSGREAQVPTTAGPPSYRSLRLPQRETAAAGSALRSLCSRRAPLGHRPAGASAEEHAPAPRSAHATAVQAAGRSGPLTRGFAVEEHPMQSHRCGPVVHQRSGGGRPPPSRRPPLAFAGREGFSGGQFSKTTWAAAHDHPEHSVAPPAVRNSTSTESASDRHALAPPHPASCIQNQTAYQPVRYWARAASANISCARTVLQPRCSPALRGRPADPHPAGHAWPFGYSRTHPA